MKIKSIKKLEEKAMTVDVEVEDTHSYQLENGAVVHNTTSKLFGLTEGWHLPSLPWYMRWVQFREDDPLVEAYAQSGYQVRKINKPRGTTIIGFPTRLKIGELDMGDSLVMAGDASPAEQYRWLQLGERYWIDGKTNDPKSPGHGMGGQISYTLKYKPSSVEFKEFKDLMRDMQSKIKCCSVMPQLGDASLAAYEYLPESPLTKAEFEAVAHAVRNALDEDVDKVHVDCAGGACPVDFNKGAAAAE